MKIKILLSILTLVVICSWTSTTKPEFLFLNEGQLNPLGLELNKNGLFYKNVNPEWKQDNRKYSGLSFYCVNDNYMTSIHFSESDELKAKSPAENIIKQMVATSNDFYPLLIGNTKGNMTLDDKTLPADMKLMPIAICMSETKLSHRNDTIVIWMKPSAGLQKALPTGINMNDYLKTPMKSK